MCCGIVVVVGVGGRTTTNNDNKNNNNTDKTGARTFGVGSISFLAQGGEGGEDSERCENLRWGAPNKEKGCQLVNGVRKRSKGHICSAPSERTDGNC